MLKSTSEQLAIGQRYMSLGEPNLGLGIIELIADKTLTVIFPATGDKRTYGLKSAPLKRIRFEIGDEIQDRDGNGFIIKEIHTTDSGLLVYIGENDEDLIEIDILDSVQYQRPQEKIFNGLPDHYSLFLLRQKAYSLLNWLSSLQIRGFLGARLSLIDHQFYIASKALSHPYPRVLLADEVGLGKTIEAGLILQALYLKGRVERTLVITPSSLNFQWFIEMYRKYNLTFSVVNENTVSSESETANPFDENNLVITSLELMTGSEKARELARSANWDLLIVDEAHKLFWKVDGPSKQYEAVESLSQNIPGVILLTATPEIYGQAGHFARLRLLDSDRFSDFNKYKQEQEKYRSYADLVRNINGSKSLSDDENKILKELGQTAEELKSSNFNALVDRHGPGRILFRNTRKVIDNEFNYFPKRIEYPYALSGNSDKDKLVWLGNFLSEDQNKKFLLIAKKKEDIIKIEKYLTKNTVNNKIGLFHEELSLMARDRQAAYFQDPDGANLLLCSEIGSEGRNFQFCSDLILFDLPSTVDLVEQRIGRLDRIGQNNDVSIHIPYLLNSEEEINYRYYKEVFEVFEKSVPGGNYVQQEIKEELTSIRESADTTKLDSFIIKAKQLHNDYIKSLEDGRDLLVEMNSFNRDIASDLTGKVQELDEDDRLKSFLENVYSEFGVDVEDTDDNSQFIKPGDNMYVPHFPSLNTEGFSYTFNRRKALEREELQFMTWDHPLVTGSLELICGEDYGNASVVVRKNGKVNPFFEFFFVISTKASKELEISKWFPPKIIRVLLNSKGEDFSGKWGFEDLNPKLEQASPEIVQKVSKSLSGSKDKFKVLLAKAKDIATKDSESYVADSINNMNQFYQTEILRLEELQKVNSLVTQEEIDQLKQQVLLRSEKINLFSMDLDSIRFIY